MKRKILKYSMHNKRKVRSKDVIALMEKLNEECNFLAVQPVNQENNFEPYVMLETTKDNKLMGIIVTLEYRGICDYCRVGIDLDETVVGTPEIVTDDNGQKLLHLGNETYNLVYSSKKYIMEKTGYTKDQIVPFVTYKAFTLDGMVLDEMATCGYRKLDEHNVYVDALYVHEDYRRCGIASTLLDLMGKDVVEQGFTHVQLDSLTTKAACEFYRSRKYMFDLIQDSKDQDFKLLPLIKDVKNEQYLSKLKCPLKAFTPKNEVTKEL